MKQSQETSYGYHLAFSSVTEFIQYATATEPLRRAENQDLLNDTKGRPAREFTNGHTPTSAAALIAEPPEYIGEMVELSSAIEASTAGQVTRRRLRRRLEDGDELDPIAWIRRDPDGWQAMRREPTQSRVLRIAANIAIDNKKTPEQLRVRGAALCAIADAATAAGFSVEIDLLNSISGLTSQRNKTHTMAITLKQADQPLDLATVAVAAGEIGFFRTIVFLAITRQGDEEAYKVDEFLGRPITAPEALAKQYDILVDSNIITQKQASVFVEKYATQGWASRDNLELAS